MIFLIDFVSRPPGTVGNAIVADDVVSAVEEIVLAYSAASVSTTAATMSDGSYGVIRSASGATFAYVRSQEIFA